VAADRDPGHGEREREVDDEQRDRAAAEHVGLLALEHDGGAEDPEDRAGGPDGDRVGARDQRSGGAGDPRDDVEQDVPERPEPVLEGPADPPDGEHVHREVDRAVVQERGREQAVPLALGEPDDGAARVDPLDEEGAVLEDPAAVRIHRRAAGELEQVDADVDPDQRLRDEARVARRALLDALDDAARALRLARVLGAADPDRREAHAVGADPAAALRARDARLAVGVAVAPHRLGHGD
jgi:hypothetical protein